MRRDKTAYRRNSKPKRRQRRRTANLLFGNKRRSEFIAAAGDAWRAFRTIEPGQVSAQRISIKVRKSCELIQECQIDSVGRAVALLGDNQFGDVLVFIALVVLLFAIDERHH